MTINEVLERLKSLTRDLEKSGLLSIDLKTMTLYGYSMTEIKKFVDFGKSKKFSPKTKGD